MTGRIRLNSCILLTSGNETSVHLRYVKRWICNQQAYSTSNVNANAPTTTQYGSTKDTVSNSKQKIATKARQYEELDKAWDQMRKRIPKISNNENPKLKEQQQDIQHKRQLKQMEFHSENSSGGVNARSTLRQQNPSLSSKEEISKSTEKTRYTRRPVSQKEKQFNNLCEAPHSVLESDYQIPDTPRRPKSLDVAIIGRPNAGKSSIINNLLNTTVSAVSAKYNTTRDRVLGILTEGNSQLIFYDTPGIIKPKEVHDFVQPLVTAAEETVTSVDVTMLIVDAVKRLDTPALEALAAVLTTSAKRSSPTILVMNKCDLVGRREELNLKLKIQDLTQLIGDIYTDHYVKEDATLLIDPFAYTGDNCFKVSALKDRGMRKLKSTLLSLAISRPWEYHSSMRSDQSKLEVVTEIIREKLFRRYNEEIPYEIEQENIGWTIFTDNSIRIDQDVIVPNARVRKMVIGKNGDAIRKVGIAARKEIEDFLGNKVHLYLNVRA